ncbi:unnamed protein product [Adineta steineri]|uniref:G-protein coupled receptors family 1 profile domain-containing protein n=1 Tax=Adineta steineri TaxID=433720 RepID=A0A815PA02_9BILA|nr:unnamed protein product [Adineta steineri]
MSSSNATLAEINALNYGNSIFYQIWTYLLLCLGTIGHSLNIYVFTRPTLRSNPCTRYFLAATITGIYIILTSCLWRYLQITYPAYNPFGYSTASCKILSFMALTSKFLCSSSSATVRAWSNHRVTYRVIIIVFIIVSIFYLYVPIIYQNINTGTKCPAAQTTFPLFSGIWNLLVFSLGPSTVMLIFGLFTIRNVQRSGRRLVPLNNQTELTTSQQEQLKRQKMADRQLLKMMLVQCAYFILSTTPLTVLYIYTALRINIVTDALQHAKDALFTNIAGGLGILSGCTSFYVFTLSSKLFRRELMQLFKCRWRPNQTITTSTGPIQRN